MKEDKVDFGLTPVNTPLDWLEARRVLFIVPRRLVKIKRLFNVMTRKDRNND